MSELESGFRIADVVGLVRRQWPILAVAAVVGAVAGYLLFASAPTLYSTTARVEVEAIPGINDDPSGNNNKNPNGVNMLTEQDLVKSDVVAEAVRAELKRPGDNRALLSHITVAADEGSNVLRITFEDDTGSGARDGANATAAAYLAQRADDAKTTVDTQITKLTAQRQDAQAGVGDAEAQIVATKDGTPERSAARTAQQNAADRVSNLDDRISQLQQLDPSAIGSIVREAADAPAPVTSKKAVGKAVGVFGLCLLAGLAVAWLLDRRDSLGGGRRRIEALLPGSAIRILPGSDGRGSAAELDAAIDRLAVDVAAGAAKGRAASVLLAGSGPEPPVALAQELASSLAFAGIPALFVVAGTTENVLRDVQVVGSFADLLTGPSITGPAALTEVAGVGGQSPPTVAWLRPRGSAEASGLLRRAVVEALVTRAGRERYEVVVFVAPAPTRTAAATALGQWVDRTVLVIGDHERSQAEPAAAALSEADIRVTEVVWT